ncbi:SLC13 family permease [Olivibacter sitiensis]|uniref:SLC13 family permease n=1 Tax=Olivibacter sitiensis TaxID=376470 RepID=UPI00040269E5|nr:SLC13 family permease [Olivibacter sitiensis]
MLITLIVLGVSVVFFAIGKVRSDMVAVCALVSLMLFNILSPEEALSGFSHPIVVMMVGLFVVGGAVIQTGLAKKISNRIMLLAGSRPFLVYLLVMLTTSAIGAFVSNTGTVALMLPIVVSLAASTNISSSRLLMPMAFASSMGGMLTLIGTPPNLVISNELVKAGYPALAFFSFSPIGLVVVAVGIAALWPLSRKFLSEKGSPERKQARGKSLENLAQEYQLSNNLYRLHVRPISPLCNKKVHEMNIAEQYNITILGISKKIEKAKPFTKAFNRKFPTRSTVIAPKDKLYVAGQFEDVKAFVEKNHLAWADNNADDTKPRTFPGNIAFDDIGLAEVVILSNSRLVNQQVRNSGFREKYNINILGIHRNSRYILQDLKNEKILAGDALLVQGEWKDISRLEEDTTEWVVVGQPMSEASKITLDYKAPLAALIMLSMVLVLAFDLLPAVTAVMLAAVAMIFTGCLRNIEAAYQTINWESILLIGAMLPMSLALEKTGASAAISNFLVNSLGNIGPLFMLVGIYLATSFLTLFINNTASAVLFAPIAIQSATELGVHPLPFLFAVAVAASMCFASPFSTPPNALVMSAGRYTFMDYVKVGLPLQLLFAIVMAFVLPLLFPF